MDDQLQDVQRLGCKRTLEIDLEQAGGSGKILPVENSSMSGQFKNLCSDVYGKLKSYCEWYNGRDAMHATPTQDNPM